MPYNNPNPFHYQQGNRYSINPFGILPYVMPLLNGPRYVPNPINGQMELHTPGRWNQHPDGSLSWDNLPVWPLTGGAETAASDGEQAQAVPVERRQPVRNLIRRIRGR
jgi:hypothetical protein